MGVSTMDSMYNNPERSSNAIALQDEDVQDQGLGHNFLYQAATVLGMLLFLFSI